MNAVQSFKRLRHCIASRLAHGGFACAGDILWRKLHDTVVLLHFQRDLKHSTKAEVRFTINLAISVDALRSVESSEVPPLDQCQWRQRLGRLLPAHTDVWWSVRDEQTAQAMCDELVSMLLEVALPKVEEMASAEALLRAWHEGRGQGLTEYERRSSFAKLLLAMGRREEARSAVRELEDASVGKSWSASAAYDVSELRKQLC